jgi:hypothetical protein
MSIVSRAFCTCLGAHRLDGAHVVQPVGQLDQDHPQILGHGDQQLTEVLGLLGLGGRKLQVGQLGDAVDQFGDLGAEQPRDLAIGRLGVLDGVVQKRRGDGGVIQPHLGQDGRHRHRMGEIRLARMARLAAMHLLGVGIGPAQQIGIAGGVVVAHQRNQVFDIDGKGRGPGGTGAQAGCGSGGNGAGRGFSPAPGLP